MTGRVVAAKFEHDAPGQTETGSPRRTAPHAVIFNLRRRDGRAKPIQPLELNRSQQYATAFPASSPRAAGVGTRSDRPADGGAESKASRRVCHGQQPTP